MHLVRKTVSKPLVWAKAPETTGYDSSHSFRKVRNRLCCSNGPLKREE